MNLLIRNIRQLVTVNAGGRLFKAGQEMRDIGVIEDATVLIQNGLFTWIGSDKDFNESVDKTIDVINASDYIALPGFVDSHTHAIFAGNSDCRMAGEEKCDLFDIVLATRSATKKDLMKLARRSLNSMLKQGTTTVEIKSGYGLNEDAEIKMLGVINDLSEESLVDIVPVFFGAHYIPPEFTDNPDQYVGLICTRLLPYIAKRKMAAFCEISCDHGYLTPAQSGEIIKSAGALSIGLKIRSSFSDQSGALELTKEPGILCFAALEKIDSAGIDALKQSGKIAAVFPGVSFFMKVDYPPARKIIDSGIPLAIASDFNPLSCMSFSMPMMMTIACRQMSISPEEAISAATLNGAAALGLSNKTGSIEVGKQADIVLYNVPNYLYLLNHFGINHTTKIIKRGTYLDF